MRFRNRQLLVVQAYSLLGLVALSLVALPAGAQDTRHGMDPATYDVWRKNYGRFARCVTQHQDAYVIVPHFDRRTPSSTGMTVPQAREELTRRVRESVGDGSLKVTRTISPPNAECEALAMALPGLRMGQYGYLESVEVVEVLGPDDMLVQSAQLIDPTQLTRDRRADESALVDRGVDRSAVSQQIAQQYLFRDELAERQKDRGFRQEFRLTGFPTRGLEPKARWKGPKDAGLQIALVTYEPTGRRYGQKHRMVAMPAEAVGLGVNEAQFVAYLAQRELTPAQFVALLTEAQLAAADRVAGDTVVFAALLPPDPDAPASSRP